MRLIFEKIDIEKTYAQNKKNNAHYTLPAN